MVKILERSRPATSLLDFTRQEIEQYLQQKLTRHNIVTAYIFGSYAQNKTSEWSDIDLMIVMQTTAPFLERAKLFDDLYALGIPIDILVYTPKEFEQLKESSSGFWRSFRESHQQVI